MSSKSVSGFFGRFSPENPETDWDDKPGIPRLVIPVCFGFFLTLIGQKTPKRTGMTSLGFTGLSSQYVTFFSVLFWPENPETDWDDNAWASQAYHPSPFQGFCVALFGQKTPKQTGMTSLGVPGLSSSQSVLGRFGFF